MPGNPQINIIKSNRRTISLQIDREGVVVVKAPRFMPKFLIDNFVNKHQEWIEEALVKTESNKQKTITKKDGEYFFLGKSLRLQLGNYTDIKVKDDLLLFPQGLLFRKDKELTEWYIRQAKEIITKQVELYAKEMKAEYKEITFSDTRSQWGRCTHDNRLQFSWRLVMSPLLVLNYVVIHELAHTMEKNHTQMFWMKVRNFNPSYRQQIKWLKEHGGSLKI